MTTEQIQCFFKIVETGSFTAAAEAMYMTQASLSKKIIALEHELSVTLFDRNKSKHTELTEAGKIVYEGFLDIQNRIDKVIEKAQNMASGISGTIRMGIFENQIIDEYLQEILNDFAKRYSNIELFVTTGSFNELIEDVQKGKLDCAVTLGYDVMGRSHIRHKTLYHLKTYLVVPNEFLNDSWKVYELKDFKDKPFLTIKADQNTFQDKMIRAQTERAGFTPQFITATDEKNFMMLLEMGRGIACLDAYSKCCKSPNVRCLSVPELEPCPFDIVWVDENTNPAFKYLIKYLNI